jgi:fructose-bisphosphate aldolase class 1
MTSNIPADHPRASDPWTVRAVPTHILAAINDARFSPVAAVLNIAYYTAKRGEITEDDAEALFEYANQVRAQGGVPMSTLSTEIVNDIKRAIRDACQAKGY